MMLAPIRLASSKSFMAVPMSFPWSQPSKFRYQSSMWSMVEPPEVISKTVCFGLPALVFTSGAYS